MTHRLAVAASVADGAGGRWHEYMLLWRLVGRRKATKGYGVWEGGCGGVSVGEGLEEDWINGSLVLVERLS